MSRFALATLLLLSLGCAASPKYTIKSSSPAYIEVDGVIACNETPCTITPPYQMNNAGGCHSSRSAILTAFPKNKSTGFVQQKLIAARCGEKSTVYFDMDIAPAVQTIQVPKS